MKRIYRSVAVAEGEGGWRVLLDGRELRSPGRAPLRLSTAELARGVADEWAAQGERIDPRAMPLTALASTVADRVAPLRAELIVQLLRYAETDLVCYRAEAPEDLVRRQAQAWDPLLDWLAMRFDARLAIVSGVLPRAQAPAAISAVRVALEGMSDELVAAASSAAAATGSLVIALALVDGRVAAEEAFACSQVDETWQMELWGEDPEATRRRAALAADVAAARRFSQLARG